MRVSSVYPDGGGCGILRVLCARVQTGDLLVFEGGVALAYVQRPEGRQLGRADESDAELGHVLLVEASASAGGMRVAPLLVRLQLHLQARPWRRCCVRLLNVERTPRFLAAFEAAASHKLGMSYCETKYTELVQLTIASQRSLLSRYGCCGGGRVKPSRADIAACSGQLFAAEFVAELWMKCGLLRNPLLGGLPASHYTRFHFDTGQGRPARQLSKNFHPGTVCTCSALPVLPSRACRAHTPSRCADATASSILCQQVSNSALQYLFWKLKLLNKALQQQHDVLSECPRGGRTLRGQRRRLLGLNVRLTYICLLLTMRSYSCCRHSMSDKCKM